MGKKNVYAVTINGEFISKDGSTINVAQEYQLNVKAESVEECDLLSDKILSHLTNISKSKLDERYGIAGDISINAEYVKDNNSRNYEYLMDVYFVGERKMFQGPEKYNEILIQFLLENFERHQKIAIIVDTAILQIQNHEEFNPTLTSIESGTSKNGDNSRVHLDVDSVKNVINMIQNERSRQLKIDDVEMKPD